MRDISIDRIMTTDPLTTGPNEPIVEARTMLESNDLNHLPVVENGKLVGILSTSDMLKFAMLDHDAKVLKSVKVRQIMKVSPHVLTVDANLRTAADKLSNGGFHALPVVTSDRTLVGIVTSSDLIQHLMKQIPTGDGSLRAKSLLSLNERNRKLEAVFEAAERYVRSGHADHEHSVLVKRLDEVGMTAAALTL
tara:strand:+ start:3208 stop:3786 length:579 start_codon:yes stop_codon:yes gene_type:complete